MDMQAGMIVLFIFVMLICGSIGAMGDRLAKLRRRVDSLERNVKAMSEYLREKHGATDQDIGQKLLYSLHEFDDN
jgi:hypothetical protein